MLKHLLVASSRVNAGGRFSGTNNWNYRSWRLSLFHFVQRHLYLCCWLKLFCRWNLCQVSSPIMSRYQGVHHGWTWRKATIFAWFGCEVHHLFAQWRLGGDAVAWWCRTSEGKDAGGPPFLDPHLRGSCCWGEEFEKEMKEFLKAGPQRIKWSNTGNVRWGQLMLKSMVSCILLPSSITLSVFGASTRLEQKGRIPKEPMFIRQMEPLDYLSSPVPIYHFQCDAAGQRWYPRGA